MRSPPPSRCGRRPAWRIRGTNIRLALDGPTSDILAAHDDTGALTGTVMAGFDGHRGWLYALAVAESERGRGLGARLVAAAEAFLRAQGAPVIRLMVRRDNEAVAGFYEGIGYERGDFLLFGKRFEG